MVAGLQRAELSDPLVARDDDEEDELELSLGLSIGGGKKRKAEIDFLSGSFPIVRPVILAPNPMPAMPLYMPGPPPCPIFPAAAFVNPKPSTNLNLNENPKPTHGENGGNRSVKMKRTPSYSGSPMSNSSVPIQGRSSSSETRTHSDPYEKKPNKQAIQEVVSKPETQAAAKEEEEDKVDHMPCVMTMGRNGNAVKGVLYRYNEKEVSIVCVCHGTPFSPEEFIRHAGGVESSNPLRQIVVVPS